VHKILKLNWQNVHQFDCIPKCFKILWNDLFIGTKVMYNYLIFMIMNDKILFMYLSMGNHCFWNEIDTSATFYFYESTTEWFVFSPCEMCLLILLKRVNCILCRRIYFVLHFISLCKSSFTRNKLVFHIGIRLSCCLLSHVSLVIVNDILVYT
jgi:hypothetical protein